MCITTLRPNRLCEENDFVLNFIIKVNKYSPIMVVGTLLDVATFDFWTLR